jgi:di/tricarboxylate transporter
MAVMSRDDRRKRNIYTALALSLVAVTFLFYPDEEGMAWMMWRDAPALALLLLAAGVLCAVLAWRTTRN